MERSSPDDARLDGKEINPSIRGIELHGIGEDSPILLQQSQVWSTGSDRTAALDIEIKQYDVAKYLRLVSALSTLRWSAPDVFAKDLEKAGLQPRESMRDYQFRYLVRILLQSSAKWNSGAIPTISEIAKHCEWVPNTWCEADLEFVESDSDDMWPSLWRMAYQQFHDLEGEAGLLRSIVIYRQLAPKHAAHHTYPLYDKFKEITGIELDNFWWLSLTLKGWFGRHPGRSVTLKDLVQDTAVLGITEESIQCYTNSVYKRQH